MKNNKIVPKSIEIGLLGDEAVGKTAIFNFLQGLEFSYQMIATRSCNKVIKSVIVKNKEEVKVVLWDNAGGDRFRGIAFGTLRKADGIIYVFDLYQRDSFVELEKRLNEIEIKLNVSCIILFGNKSDKEKSEWKVTFEEVNKYAKEKGIPYFEVSAKTGKGINEGLLYIVNEIYDKKF